MNALDLFAGFPNHTPIGTDLILVNDINGIPFIINLDKLAVLINGFTISDSVIASAEYAHIVTHDAQTSISHFAGSLAWFIVKADTNAFYTGANPTRFTISAGVTKVEVTCQLTLAVRNPTTVLSIVKGGNLAEPICTTEIATGGNLTTGIIDVVGNEFFEMHVGQDVDYNPMTTWFKIRVVERTP